MPSWIFARTAAACGENERPGVRSEVYANLASTSGPGPGGSAGGGPSVGACAGDAMGGDSVPRTASRPQASQSPRSHSVSPRFEATRLPRSASTRDARDASRGSPRIRRRPASYRASRPSLSRTPYRFALLAKWTSSQPWNASATGMGRKIPWGGVKGSEGSPEARRHQRASIHPRRGRHLCVPILVSPAPAEHRWEDRNRVDRGEEEERFLETVRE